MNRLQPSGGTYEVSLGHFRLSKIPKDWLVGRAQVNNKSIIIATNDPFNDNPRGLSLGFSEIQVLATDERNRTDDQWRLIWEEFLKEKKPSFLKSYRDQSLTISSRRVGQSLILLHRGLSKGNGTFRGDGILICNDMKARISIVGSKIIESSEDLPGEEFWKNIVLDPNS